MKNIPLYSYYPKTTPYNPRKPWERSFLVEHSHVERKRIENDNTWKMFFNSSRADVRVQDRKSFIRKANISSILINEIRKHHPSADIMVSLPTHNSDVNTIITIFDENLKTPPDGAYVNLIKPLKIRIMQPNSLYAINALFVDDYTLVETDQWYKDYKPSRTNKKIITKYMSEILGTDPWLSEILTLPTIGAPMFLSHLPGINMHMDVQGMSDYSVGRVSEVLLKMVPLPFRVDVPQKLLHGWDTTVSRYVKVRLSEKICDPPFKIGSMMANRKTVKCFTKTGYRNEISRILYGHSDFDVLEHTIKYANIPLYLTDEYFPFYTHDVSKIVPDDEVHHNVIWRHGLCPYVARDSEYQKYVDYIKNEMIANWSGEIASNDEEIGLMFESTGGIEFINRLIQASQSESRLSQHPIVEEEDVKSVVKGVESSFTTLFADEEFKKKWVLKRKDEMYRRKKKRSTDQYHTIKNILMGEQEGLTPDEIYERTKRKWDNRKEFDSYIVWLKDTAHSVWEFKGKYRWL